MITATRFGQTSSQAPSINQARRANLINPAFTPKFGAEQNSPPSLDNRKKGGFPRLLSIVTLGLLSLASLRIGFLGKAAFEEKEKERLLAVEDAKVFAPENALATIESPNSYVVITKDKHVYDRVYEGEGMRLRDRFMHLGWIDSEGNTFHGSGKKVGHANDTGQIFSVKLPPERVWAQVNPDGTIYAFPAPGLEPDKLSAKIQDPNGNLSLKEKAAAVLLTGQPLTPSPLPPFILGL